MFQHYTRSDILDYIQDNYSNLYDQYARYPQEKMQRAFNIFVNLKLVPPVNVDPPGGKSESEQIEMVFALFLCLVSRIQGDDGGEQYQIIERNINLFLSKVHHVDTDLIGTKDKVKPMLASRMNFLTMLNIPRDIKRLNHLRYLWELGGMVRPVFVRVFQL